MLSYDPNHSLLGIYSAAHIVLSICYAGSTSDKPYHPTYHSAAGERSGDVMPRYLTQMETQTPNSNPDQTSGDDSSAEVCESDFLSSLEHNQGKL